MIGETNPEETRLALANAGPITNAALYNNGKELANAIAKAGGAMPPTGAAGGVLAGSYPNPTLAASIPQSPRFTGNAPRITVAETGGAGTAALDLIDNNSSIASEGMQALYDSASGHSYLRSTFSNGNLYLGAGSSLAAQVYIDPSGRVRTPNQPLVSLYSTNITNAGNAIIWNGTYVNVGSMWPGAGLGYQVNVPVTGTYLVTYEGMSTNTTNTAYYLDLWKNASPIATVRQYEYDSAASHKHISMHVYLQLAANDYIWWVCQAAQTYADGAGYCHGSVSLVR